MVADVLISIRSVGCDLSSLPDPVVSSSLFLSSMVRVEKSVCQERRESLSISSVLPHGTLVFRALTFLQ
jgi:hypothetical protein